MLRPYGKPRIIARQGVKGKETALLPIASICEQNPL